MTPERASPPTWRWREGPLDHARRSTGRDDLSAETRLRVSHHKAHRAA
ncbi:hypothetical protein [Streptomyces sp. 1222.5]